jgi:flagellar operon protein
MVDPLRTNDVQPLDPTTARPPAPIAGRTGGNGGASFEQVLEAKLHSAPVKFSGHALQRIERRGIRLDDTTLGRLSSGVQRAAAKGARDSLVLVDQTAFVVSVPNRTVITAVDQEHMKQQVFTNIDSAVIS